MKILLLLLIPLFYLSQIDCYTALRYKMLYVDGEDLISNEVTGRLGLCFSNNYVAIDMGSYITTYPILQNYIEKRISGEGYQVISFYSSGTEFEDVGKWKVEIIYQKPRLVIISNTISGRIYIMEFNNKELLTVKNKKINVDSLGALIKQPKINKYKNSEE